MTPRRYITYAYIFMINIIRVCTDETFQREKLAAPAKSPARLFSAPVFCTSVHRFAQSQDPNLIDGANPKIYLARRLNRKL
jgi:hypothetical protein